MPILPKYKTHEEKELVLLGRCAFFRRLRPMGMAATDNPKPVDLEPNGRAMPD